MLETGNYKPGCTLQRHQPWISPKIGPRWNLVVEGVGTAKREEVKMRDADLTWAILETEWTSKPTGTTGA